jgi:hypothetical protein
VSDRDRAQQWLATLGSSTGSPTALRPDQYIVISGKARIYKTTKPVDGRPALGGVIDG